MEKQGGQDLRKKLFFSLHTAMKSVTLGLEYRYLKWNVSKSSQRMKDMQYGTTHAVVPAIILYQYMAGMEYDFNT